MLDAPRVLSALGGHRKQKPSPPISSSGRQELGQYMTAISAIVQSLALAWGGDPQSRAPLPILPRLTVSPPSVLPQIGS